MNGSQTRTEAAKLLLLDHNDQKISGTNINLTFKLFLKQHVSIAIDKASSAPVFSIA